MKKWREIPVRLFDVIKFLAKQNLAFHAHIEDNTSSNRGNSLALVHLLAKYDPVLRKHLVKIKISQKDSVNYLSTITRNKFIAIVGNLLRQQIISRVQKVEYSSIIFDSTPQDLTNQVARYVKIEKQNVEVVESFIDFIETKSKTTEDISDMILKKLEDDGLHMMNCRGRAYDTTALMTGKHTGVQ